MKANYWMTTRIQKFKNYLHQVYFGKSKSYTVKILGIILLTLGIFLFWAPFGFDKKISITLIFIAIFIFLFFPENITKNDIEVFVFFFLTGWLIIMSFITDDTMLDSFFLFIVFGILICKELANGYLTPPLKKKLSIISLIFFSMSVILIVEKVISYFIM